MFSEMKLQFKQGGYLTRLLYINCCVFLVIALLLIICRLFNLPGAGWIAYLELPADPGRLLRTPWTPLTYMFVHVDFIHVLFNMLMLYWFGRIFLEFYNQKQLVGLYILGGLAGALFYVLGVNFIPYFASVRPAALLCGASASVMALIFAAVVHSPEYRIRLALIGEIRLKYLGLIILLLDFVCFAGSNLGGTLAHAGGCIMGVAYGLLYVRKGIDLTSPITAIMNFFSSPRFGKVGFKKSFGFANKRKKEKEEKKPRTDREWNEHNSSKDERINAILEKIKKTGYSGLTDEEKRELFDMSSKR